MPVELESDLKANGFWQSVKTELMDILPEAGLSDWKFVLRPAVRDFGGKCDPVTKEIDVPVYGDGRCVPTLEADGALTPRDVAQEIISDRRLKR
jgi:hypothetical protein